MAKRLGIAVRGTKAMCFMGHDKASPSLSFLKSRNTWRCFGACGKHGDTIALVMEKEQIDFKSALAWFEKNFGGDARPVGGEIQPVALGSKLSNHIARSNPVFAPDAELYAWLIGQCPAVSSPTEMDYLASHGISPECANRFRLRELLDPESLFDYLAEKWGTQRIYRSGIAWGPDENAERLIWEKPALLLPFHQDDAVIYLQARMFAGKRKYLNPRGIRKPLFNGNRLSELPAESGIHICEGVPTRWLWNHMECLPWECWGRLLSARNGWINL